MEEKLTQDPKSSKAIFIITALVVFALFALMLYQGPWEGSSIRDMNGQWDYVENPWVLRQGDEVLCEELELPEYMELEQGKLYSLTTRMTYDGSKDEMPYGYIHLDHAYCRVLLDGRELFSCMPEDLKKWDASKSPGFIYKAFPLPADCQGKELEVQILPPLTTSVEYGLPELQFGDFTTSLRAATIRDMPHDVVTVLCVLLGAAAILFSTFSLRGSDYREGMSIGAFSLLFSLYLITECNINSYYISNPYYIYLLNYIPFSLLPISLMGFMRERLLEKHRRICTGVIAAESVFFLVELVLHFGGILDMRELIPAIHVIYFAEMALVIVLVQAMKDRKRKASLIRQITPVIIGMLLDALIYWLHWEIGGNDATFTILGVIIFLCIELIHVGRSSVSIYTESVRSSLYRQLAFVDGLTEVGNRRAFDQAIDRIVTGSRISGSTIVVSCDVNMLKYVNDHFGHAAGDELIRSAARIMKEAAGDRGEVFRTGGDEFAIFLYDTGLPLYERIAGQMARGIAEFNEKHDFTLSLAMGHVQLRENQILEAVQEADRLMYADKARSRQEKKPSLTSDPESGREQDGP